MSDPVNHPKHYTALAEPMTDLRTAAQQALDALYRWHMTDGETADLMPAFEALRAALAEPVQEPVAWMCSDPDLAEKGYSRFSSRCEGAWNIPVYTSPPQRKPESVALDWLHKWANQDDGEPETQWHEGYEAARRVVQIHLTTPPQRKPLTEEEIQHCFKEAGITIVGEAWTKAIRAIEWAHGIK